MILLLTFGGEKTPSKHMVYRCQSNEWVRADIAVPKKGNSPVGWDTSFAWDPIHKAVVMIDEAAFAGPATTFLLRYDDKKVKLVADAKE